MGHMASPELPNEKEAPSAAAMNPMTPQTSAPAVSPELSLWDWLTRSSDGQWLLPATGAWILGLDWFLFSQETISIGLATPLTAILGFVGGGIGTYFFQTRYAGEKSSSAAIKSIIAGFVVGIPVPLAGSFVGGWILLNSGLHSLRDRLLRRNK